jgi:hypothetical protein
MYRRWKSFASPENADARQEQTAYAAALKRDEPAGKVCKQARWNTIGQ